jgi:hypothetical protein
MFLQLLFGQLTKQDQDQRKEAGEVGMVRINCDIFNYRWKEFMGIYSILYQYSGWCFSFPDSLVFSLIHEIYPSILKSFTFGPSIKFTNNVNALSSIE